MSEPARPSSEDENAVPMPFSGAARPAFRSENMVTLLVSPVLMESMAPPTDWMVSSKPQKVPSRPRNTKRPTM